MIATGQCACLASAAAVDPSTMLATRPIPTDPTHIMEESRDSSARGASTYPHPRSTAVSTFTGFPVASTAADAAQCRLGVFHVQPEVLSLGERRFLDVRDMDEAQWDVATGGFFDRPCGGADRGFRAVNADKNRPSRDGIIHCGLLIAYLVRFGQVHQRHDRLDDLPGARG